jgi:hypothetical protein
MMHSELPSQSRLAELFDYSLMTGRLVWRIQLTSRTVAGCDAGTLSKQGYRKIKIDGKSYLSHRLIWKLVTGDDPGDLCLDHIDGDKTNNSWHNLRLATKRENCCNQPIRKRNEVGLKGVSRQYNKYHAKIQVNGHWIYLGSFSTPEEAHAAYCGAAKIGHGDFARFH